MAPHGLLSTLGVACLKRGEDVLVFLDGGAGAARVPAGPEAVDADLVIELVAQRLDQAFVLAAADDAEVEILVEGFLIIRRAVAHSLGTVVLLEEVLEFDQ